MGRGPCDGPHGEVFVKLQVPFIQLPLAFDAGVLAAEIDALGEAPWRPHPQGFAGNSMLPLIAVDGDPANEAFAGAMWPTPDLLRCPYLAQAMASFGATLGRSRLMRLSGHAEVTRHADQGYYWSERVRVHVPIVTQPTVRFECGNAAINMAAGECWIFDTWRQHRVLNDAVQARIHLVADTVGGDAFWQLVAQGRGHEGPRGPGAWQPRLVAPQPGAAPALRCEASNVPAVMSPWELKSHLGFLFAEAVPHPNLAQLQPIVGRFYQRWRGLWAQYGEHPDGRAEFRDALKQFMLELREPAKPLRLQNELEWYGTLQAMVARAAVAADETTRSSAREQLMMGDNA